MRFRLTIVAVALTATASNASLTSDTYRCPLISTNTCVAGGICIGSGVRQSDRQPLYVDLKRDRAEFRGLTGKIERHDDRLYVYWSPAVFGIHELRFDRDPSARKGHRETLSLVRIDERGNGISAKFSCK
jgi:hypothetical protein